MIELIDKAKAAGDTLGGVFSVVITGCPVGLGSHVHWDRKLEARLCWAMMSIQAMKGVEIGMGFECPAGASAAKSMTRFSTRRKKDFTAAPITPAALKAA